MIKEKLQKFIGNIVRVLGITTLKVFDYMVEVFTANKPILNEFDLSFMNILRENYDIILQEYNAVQNRKMQNVQDFYKVKTDLKYDDNWKAIPIILFNYTFIENAERYPQTFKIIQQIPGCNAAMFSVLGPRKYIPPHKGIYKGIYRCLFTLKTTENSCWIIIENQKIYFKNNTSIVFDETFMHEVHNDSEVPRVALYLDIYRQLPFPINIFNKIVYSLLRKSAFVQDIITEYQKIEGSSVQEFQSAKPISL